MFESSEWNTIQNEHSENFIYKNDYVKNTRTWFLRYFIEI